MEKKIRKKKNVEKVVQSEQKNYLEYLEDMDIKNVMIEGYIAEEEIKNCIAEAMEKRDWDLLIMAHAQKEKLERKKLEKMKAILENCEKKLEKVERPKKVIIKTLFYQRGSRHE